MNERLKAVSHIYRLVIVGCFMFTGIYAQVNPNNPPLQDSLFLAGKDTLRDDSTMVIDLKPFRKFSNKRDEKRYGRLAEIVKKVYPIAKMAGVRMEEYAAAVDTLRRGQIKDLVAQIEDEVKNKYGADLKKLTFKEGIVLLKLLDRQTAKTPYRIIKELKNGFSAMIWQGLASLFEYDLKKEFSPTEDPEDEWIDEICILIDNGKI